MLLENVVFDARVPQHLGRFWEAAVGGERLTDGPEGYETRSAVDDGPVLDLCFQPVAEPAVEPSRLVLQLAGEVERLLGLGARSLDGGRGTQARLADPEGNPFSVVADPPPAGADCGLVALLLDTADPVRDAAFWSWLTGWHVTAPGHLRHPSGRGPRLELREQSASKGGGKSRLHLDVRLDEGEDPDAVEAGIVERGGARFEPGWGELPWRSYTDPSGNELCVLPARH